MRPRNALAAHQGADPTLEVLYDVVSPAVEETLLAAIRELALATPAPRHDPCFGLDRPGGASLRVLDRLTRHGDFRKYALVLDVGAGLGGVARWLALRYGCRVVALDACARLVATGVRLSRRARAARVQGVCGSFEAMPARDGVFTQIWSVEALHHARDRRRALGELFRVLRPGCTLALQEIVRRGSAVPQIGGAWRHGLVDEYLDALDAAGFRDLIHEDVTVGRGETSPLTLSARARVERLLAAQLPADDPWHAAAEELRRVEALVAGPDYRVVHFFARRPSV